MVNEVRIIGYLGSNPELSYTGTGARAVLSVATNTVYKKGTEVVTETAWHRCTCFGATAENISKLATKGSLVWLSGRITYYQVEENGKKFNLASVLFHEWRLLSGKDPAKMTNVERYASEQRKNETDSKFENKGRVAYEETALKPNDNTIDGDYKSIPYPQDDLPF